jgi:hypothetical protein
MNTNKKVLTTTFLVLCFSILTFQSAFSQFFIGGSYGIQIPGRQDLKFKQYDVNGNLTQYLKTTYVFSNISSIRNLHLTYWQKKLGFRLEYLNWEHTSTAKTYLINQVPEFNTTEESRGGVFLMGLMRTQFPFKKTKDNSFINKSYSYFGFGYGVLKTEINHGKQADVKSGLQATYGITIPITKRLRGLVEAKYILTHDADNVRAPVGTTVIDTSGHWTLFRFGPHLDTKYHTIQIGIQWDIAK